MNACVDIFFRALQIIVPVITFILGSHIANRNFERQLRLKTQKERFQNFYLPFAKLTIINATSDNKGDDNRFNNYHESVQREIFKLYNDNFYLASYELQKLLNEFPRIFEEFNWKLNDEVELNRYWSSIMEIFLTEYHSFLSDLKYPSQNL